MMMSSHKLFIGCFLISILYILSGFIYIIGGFSCVGTPEVYLVCVVGARVGGIYY